MLKLFGILVIVAYHVLKFDLDLGRLTWSWIPFALIAGGAFFLSFMFRRSIGKDRVAAFAAVSFGFAIYAVHCMGFAFGEGSTPATSETVCTPSLVALILGGAYLLYVGYRERQRAN